MLTAVAMKAGLQWYWAAWVVLLVFAILVGRRRILRPGLNRTADEIICRYTPWYEGDAYFLFFLLPFMGIAEIAAGRDPDNPAWLRFFGVLLVGVLPLMLWSALYVRQRSFLRICPSALTLRLAARGSMLTEIHRDQVASITAMIVTKDRNKSLQTEIAYHPSGSDDTMVETVLLGLHLTVRPVNLANALMAWYGAAIDDPDELLDLIEYVLRARSLDGVPVPPSRSALDRHRDTPPDP